MFTSYCFKYSFFNHCVYDENGGKLKSYLVKIRSSYHARKHH